MKKIYLLTAALFLALRFCAFGVSAPVQHTEDYYVNDYADIIDTDTENYIMSYDSVLDGKTGGQIVVLTVKTLGGTEIEDYAYNVFNGWGIGSADKNNGLLILIAESEQDYWVMPGTGTERFLPSGRIGTILQTYMEPAFARGDYSTAVRSAFAEFYKAYETNYNFTYESALSEGYAQQARGARASSCASCAGGSCASCVGCGLGAAACSLGCASCAGGGGGLGLLIIVVIAVIIYGLIKRGRGGGSGGTGGRRYYGGGSHRSYGRPSGGRSYRSGAGRSSGGFGRPSGGRPGGGSSRGGGAGRH